MNWDCTVCTFANKASTNTCEMCMTSRGTSRRQPKSAAPTVQFQYMTATARPAQKRRKLSVSAAAGEGDGASVAAAHATTSVSTASAASNPGAAFASAKKYRPQLQPQETQPQQQQHQPIRPGRPPGSGRPVGRPPGSGRPVGRPPGSSSSRPAASYLANPAAPETQFVLYNNTTVKIVSTLQSTRHAPGAVAAPPTTAKVQTVNLVGVHGGAPLDYLLPVLPSSALSGSALPAAAASFRLPKHVY